jgi:hypothetical protein
MDNNNFDENSPRDERIAHIVDALVGLDLEEIESLFQDTMSLCKLTLVGADA